MIHQWIYGPLLLGLYCLVGCGGSLRPEERTTAEALDTLLGRRIQFQHNDTYYINGKKTKIVSKPANWYKIVVFATPDRCHDCALRLGEWSLKLKELSHLQLSPEIIFIIQQTDYTSFEHYSHVMMPNFPFIYDTTGIFLIINRLPQNIMYHTFLTDSQNRIVLMGSPLGNATMWELYKSTIAKLVENDGTLPTEPEK